MSNRHVERHCLLSPFFVEPMSLKKLQTLCSTMVLNNPANEERVTA